MRPWLLSLGVSLALTLLIEVGFASACGKRGRDLVLVGLANILTNPVVVLAALLFRTYTSIPEAAYVTPMELLAVITEALIYKKGANSIHRPLLFSLCANILSYGLGLVIGQIV
jgi:hypothetical protein